MNKLQPIILLLSVFSFFACEKDTHPEVMAPDLKLEAPSDRGRSFVTLNGSISNLSQVKEAGFVIWETGTKGNEINQAIEQLSNLRITANIKKLKPGTTYSYYMYAGNDINRKTTEEQDFTTPKTSAALVGPTSKSETGSSFSAQIEDTGGSEITTKGFCWSTSGTASIFDKTVLVKDNKTDIVATIPDLLATSNYSIRAFAQNEEGYLAYGPEYVVHKQTQFIDIPDKYFKQYLIEEFDTNGDNEISTDEANTIKEIDIETDKIYSVKGIEYFYNLESLCCAGDYYDSGNRGELSSIDLSQNSKLKELYISYNKITTLTIYKNQELTILDIEDNQISLIDVSKNIKLKELHISKNKISNIDVSKNNMIEILSCSNNNIEKLDISNNVLLEELSISNNKIKSINLEKNTHLTSLSIHNTEIGPDLDISNNTKLKYLLAEVDINGDGHIDGTEINNNLKTIWVWKTFDFESLPNTFHIPANAIYKIK